jgi:RNA polymerase sigma factor (sigma-70 family)
MTVDSKFWDKVYRKNAPKLIGVCRRYVQNDNVAEDLVHETFLVAISKINTYSGSGSIEAWLRKIAVNISLMHLRKDKTKIDAHDLIANIEDNYTGNGIEEIAEQDKCYNLENNFFLSAIDKLPVHHKTVFNLYVLDNYSHKEIAEELKISVGTSKSHLARARKKLQLELKEKLGEDKLMRGLGVGAIFIFISAISKAMVIDTLFRFKLKHLSIKTSKFPDFSSLDIDKQAKINTDFSKLFVANRSLIYVKSLVATVAFLAVGSEIANINNFKSPQITEPIKEVPITQLDTLKNIKTKKTTEAVNSKIQDVHSSKSLPDTQGSKNILVKKQIVKKQTIKVHNTVIVYDTVEVD